MYSIDNDKHRKDLNSIEKYTALSIFCILALLQLYRILLGLLEMDAKALENYEGYAIPDLMINYQGGLVRRGLLGEILFQIFQIHPYPLYESIVCFESVIFIAFFFIMVRMYRKMKWIPIMPIALCEGLIDYRRDFLMILMAIFIFEAMCKYMSNKQVIYIVIVIALSVLSVLIYEPSFFFIIPISIFLYWQNNVNQTKKQKIKRLVSVFSLPILTMLIVCLNKGNLQIAKDIWNSWNPMFDYLGIEVGDIPSAIKFLTYPTKDVMIMHFDADYGVDLNSWTIDYMQLSAGILFLVGFYFLTLLMPQCKYSQNETTAISDFFLFQFCCLLPMFTVLSCDFGRTMNYLVSTCFYIVYLIKKYQIHYDMPIIHPLSVKMTMIYESAIFNRSFLLFLLLLLFVPFGLNGPASLDNPFYADYAPIFLPKIQILLSYLGL